MSGWLRIPTPFRALFGLMLFLKFRIHPLGLVLFLRFRTYNVLFSSIFCCFITNVVVKSVIHPAKKFMTSPTSR